MKSVLKGHREDPDLGRFVSERDSIIHILIENIFNLLTNLDVKKNSSSSIQPPPTVYNKLLGIRMEAILCGNSGRSQLIKVTFLFVSILSKSY